MASTQAYRALVGLNLADVGTGTEIRVEAGERFHAHLPSELEAAWVAQGVLVRVDAETEKE